MDFSRCRTYGHSWFEYDSHWKPAYGVPVTLRCERCDMERRDSIDRFNGRLLNRHYYYPPHYLTRKEDVLTRSEWRLVRIKAIAKAQREARKAAKETA